MCPVNRARLLPLLLAAPLAAGCERPRDAYELDRTRVATTPSRPVLRGATSAQRFDFSMPTPEAPPENPLHWDVPEGWRELASSRMRLANLVVDRDPRAECYVSLLPGEGGGLEENVNRWRKQMGLAPLDADAIAALPTRPILGQPATYLELDGTFTGMGGESLPGSRLMGAILALPMGALFVKMTGPAEVLEAERARFADFCDSLHVATDGHSHGGEAVRAPGAPVAPAMTADGLVAGSAGPLSWARPAHWTEQVGRSMRAVSFALGAGGETECYVTILGPVAGGTAANLDRWREQLGQDPLAPGELDALPRATVLGESVPLFEGYGSFTGMTRAVADAGMLGVVAEQPGATVFVKLVGPEQDVRAARADFLAFCASLELAP